MLSFLSMLFGSSALGTLIGGLFAFLNKKNEIEAKKIDAELQKGKWAQELELRRADLEQVKAESQGKREVAVVEGDATIEAARMTAIAASQASDRISADEYKEAGWWKWTLVLATAFRSFIRPLATVLLTAAALLMAYVLLENFFSSGWKTLEAKDQLAMGYTALNWVFASASSALSYWFVSRGSNPK